MRRLIFQKHAPLKYLMIAWAAIAVGFLVGPASYPSLGVETIAYLGMIVCVVAGGYLLGLRFANANLHLTPVSVARSLDVLRIPWLVGSAVSMVGSMYAFLLLSRAGRTVENSLEMTGMVRQTQAAELGLTGAVANLFGFMSVSWLVIGLLMLRHCGGLRSKLNWVGFAFSAGGVGFLLLTYVANVNRTAFLFLFLLLVLYVPVFEHGDIRGTLRRTGLIGLAAVTAVFALVFSYILFIAVKRSGGDIDNAMFIDAFIRTRYQLPGPLAQGGVADGLYKLQWYASHQLANLDLLLGGGQVSAVRFDPAHIFFWPYQQAGRFVPELAQHVTSIQVEGATIAEASGGFSWQWYTGFAAVILGFGIVGSLPVVFSFSVIIGFSYGRLVTHGSVVSGLLALWLLALALLMMIYMPVDNFVHANIFYLFSANGFLLLLGKKNI